jgi:hypothetical protein
MDVGYKLSSEEHGPNELVRFATLAEEHGFGFAMISDHFHPWIDRQGQSPFVWSVIGAIAQATKAAAPRYGRDLSDGAGSSRHRRAGGGHRGHNVAWAILSRRGYRGKPERAHRRSGLAGDRRASGAPR